MIRPIQDNVLIILEPNVPRQTAAGVYTVPTDASRAYAHRTGYVLAVGPGHYRPKRYRGEDTVETVFVPTEVKPGEKVVVHVNAGDRYTYTKRQDMADMYARQLTEWGIPLDTAEFRMVREAEVLAVVVPEVREGAAAAE